MKELEYSTKQMIGYFLVINRKFENYKDKLLFNYIEELKKELNSTEKMYILGKVKISEFANFIINHQVNTEEIFCYAIVVFNRLLNYYHREFSDKDIIKEVENVMIMYSARTVKREAENILKKYNK